MAFEAGLKKIPGLTAGADLSAATSQFKFVKYTAVQSVVLCTSATDIPCGVLQNSPASGAIAEVAYEGISKVRAGADLGFGDLVGTDSSGQAVALVAGTDTTKYVCGRVILDNAASGGYATITLACGAPHRAA